MASTPTTSRCLWCAWHLTSLATARESAPQSPAARTPATCAATGAAPVSGSQAGTGQACVCQQGGAPGAAHRGSRRWPHGTLEGARRAIQRRRPARQRPTAPRRCGSCAAALVTTTTVACQVFGSRARCRRVQMATIAGRCERRNCAASAHPCWHTHACWPNGCLVAAHRRGARRCAGGWCARGWR